VHTTEDIARDPQFAYRQAFQTIETRDGGSLRLGRAAWLANEANIQLARGPDYSEHTVEVLQQLLGYSEEQISALEAAGAIVIPAARVPSL
jgi:crotonobetainyl-CoA:carnitine CoA-transferase CaiB-like acyl-CoA transferase